MRYYTGVLTPLESLESRLFLAAQAYDWNYAAMKGDGYIDGIVYSQAAPDVAYINTDIGGAYRLDPATNKWSPLNDWSQYNDWAPQNMGAQSFAVDPTDPNRVYMVAGTYQSPAAILRSSDQGRTWQRTDVSTIKVDGNGWGRSVGQRLMVDPNNPSTLYYGAQYYDNNVNGANGLWKSTNFGANWSQVSTFTAKGDLWNNNYSNANGVGLPFVVFDKSSGSPGSPTPIMYVGVATVANTSSKVYVTTDGGTSFAPIANQPSLTLTPNRAVLTPDGSTMYVAYSDQSGPYAATTGALYKVTNPSSPSATWTLVTPSNGAYSAVVIDPTNQNIVYAAVFDRYPDEIYRTTNAGASWTPLQVNSHLDNSSAAYASSLSTHWLTDLKIDPFNRDVAMYTTGYGIFRTTNLTAATPTWSFFNDGFEQSAVLEINSPNTGSVHLIDAIGDRDGFRHDDLTQSPSIGRLGQLSGIAEGTSDDIDSAFNDSNYVVRLVRVSPYVQYSVDNGQHWAWMPTTGSSGSTSGGGNLAISADGTKIVYEPGGSGRERYSTRTGSTWSNWVSTGITNQPANGAKIIADLGVGATTTFYAYSGTTVSRSTDGGQTWAVMTTTAPSSLNWIRAVPGQAGNLVAQNGNLYRSTNGGATWSQLSAGVVTTANVVGVGAGPSAGAYPSIYVGGTVSGQTGFFRSDDQGATWTMISDLAHQFGFVTVIQGDPRIYGRLYVGTNGRGIQYADIHQSLATLPAGWATQDIGSPGSAGSSGESSGTFEAIGGGLGIPASGALSDQFRFTYEALTGDATITARVMGVPNANPANTRAKAGVMIRQSLASNAANAFVALTPGSVNGVMFQTRSAAAGSTATPGSATLGIWPPYWVRLVRSGDQFTAFASPDGTTWTQLGAPQTISMSGTVFVGLAVSSSDNNQLNISTFQNVSVAVGDTTPPSVSAADFLFMHSPNKLTFTFSEDVSASLGIDDLVVSQIGGGTITPTNYQYDAGTNTATFTLPVALANANYTATLLHGGINDAALNTMSADYTLPFFVLAADANRDRIVDATDLGILSLNWQQSGRDWTQGDFNDDGVVDVNDLNILASNWQSSVAQLPTLSPIALPPAPTPIKKPVNRRVVEQITEL